jgi:putative membrane protein
MDNDEGLKINDNKQKVVELQNDEWQRLSLISIVYFTVHGLFNFGNALFYLIPAIALNFDKIKENPQVSLAVASAILLIFVVMGCLNYWFYRFKVGKSAIEIKQGVFKKSHIDLPFERIQNVKLSQPLYYRFNDYSCIELDTAGSAKQEAKIVALKTPLAQQFRLTILGSSKHNDSDSEESPEDLEQDNASNEVVLNRRSMHDLIIHGLTNNRIWIFLGALAPFYNAISEGLSDIFVSIGFDAQAYFSLETQAWWEFGLHVLSVVMVVMLVVVSLSVAGAILMFYNFTLSKVNDRYIRRSGLLTKHEVSMKLSRIQIMVQAQDWLDVLLGRVNLLFEQNTSGAAKTNQGGEQMANKLLVPSVKLAESQALMKDAMPSQNLGEQVFKAISKRYILRGMLLIGLPISAAVFAIIFHKKPIVAIVAASIIFAVITLCYGISWKRWAYSYDAEYIYIRKGFLGVDYYCFPIQKVQQTQFKQSSFMRPYQLATLKVILASGAKHVPYMPAQEVQKIVNMILDKLVTDKRSWM